MRICSLRAVPFLFVYLEYAAYDCINLIMTQFIRYVFAYEKFLHYFWLSFFYDFCLNHSLFFFFYCYRICLALCSAQNITRKNIFICIRSFKAPPRFLLLFKNDDFALDNAKEWKKLGSQFICWYKKIHFLLLVAFVTTYRIYTSIYIFLFPFFPSFRARFFPITSHACKKKALFANIYQMFSLSQIMVIKHMQVYVY